MKTKVYQVKRIAFDDNGDLLPPEKRLTKVFCIGTIVMPDRKLKTPLVEEEIWNLFNWTCWGWPDRTNAYKLGIRKGIRLRGIRMFPNRNSRGYCNSDIFFKLPDKWYIALSSGWGYAESYKEAELKCIESQMY